jgi:hypothetical protein
LKPELLAIVIVISSNKVTSDIKIFRLIRWQSSRVFGTNRYLIHEEIKEGIKKKKSWRMFVCYNSIQNFFVIPCAI